MNTFEVLLVVAGTILVGNILRLLSCSVVVIRQYPKHATIKDLIKSILLLVSFCLITAPFIYSAYCVVYDVEPIIFGTTPWINL